MKAMESLDLDSLWANVPRIWQEHTLIPVYCWFDPFDEYGFQQFPFPPVIGVICKDLCIQVH